MSAVPAVPLRVVLSGHVLFTLLHSLLFVNIFWLMPMLVRLRFGSDDPRWKDWQTTLVTAAVPTFMMFSIFWAELLRRVPVRRYLLICWACFALPLGCVALAQNYWQFLICHLVASIGFASWTPVNGQLLKHLYADHVRGRAFGVLRAATQVGSIAAAFAVGTWVEQYPNAFRVFFPAAAAVQLVGVGVLIWLVRLTKMEHKLAARAAPSWRALLRPVWHLGAVLRGDPTFLRYELAFMTYGAAFMACEALLPVLATDRLGMRYEDYAHSTQMAGQIGMLLMTLPVGWLMDRIGPVRTSGLSFAVLAVYPVLLLSAGSVAGIGVASGVWGLAMAGVIMGWTLGPVNLAPSAEKVPQYSAIHATLVGVRGVLFQGLAMMLYKLTGSFTWPLGLAALAFLAAAAQMWWLHAGKGRGERATALRRA